MAIELSDADVFARCDRFLFGHGRMKPHAELAALLEETPIDLDVDHYGTGALIEDFEKEVAETLGKEAAVFVPSGTMAQQIALRVWSDRHGSRTVAFHPTCHLEIREDKNYARLHGLQGKLIGDPGRLLTLDDLEAIAEPISALLLELPQREIGGQSPPWEELQAQVSWARDRGIALHMDGARLWEAVPFYDRPYAEIAGLFDSVYVSFYKGIGAIAGAALAGPTDVIAEARVWINRQGGTLIRLFPYVLSAQSAFRRRLDCFPRYYKRALDIAATLSAIPGIEVKPNPPQSGMMHVYLHGDREALEAASKRIAAQHGVLLFRRLQAADVPGYWWFELSVGDGAQDIADEELRRYFSEIAVSGSTPLPTA